MTTSELQQLADKIKHWGSELGFQQVSICDTDVKQQFTQFTQWLDNHYHGEMTWLERNNDLRQDPAKLHPGTLRIIAVRMNYLPPKAKFASNLQQPNLAYISRYAQGRDYHTLMRKRLKLLAEKIKQYCQQLNFRPFVDSAPIMERVIAEKAGLGWVGKHSLIINQQAGSLFFLGELLVNIPLPIDKPVSDGCQRCSSCITTCPTSAIVEPYVIDARRCISYLTIEYDGIIAEELRPLMGNRIYGCDDCQLICPWNRYAQETQEVDFYARQQFQLPQLIELFRWNEKQFLLFTQGSAIRRIGYHRWLRNIAIALGNASYDANIISELENKKGISAMIDEHIQWALEQQQRKKHQGLIIFTNKQQRLIRSIQKGLPFTEEPV